MSQPFENSNHTTNLNQSVHSSPTTSIVDDSLLWKSFKSGDESAFIAIYKVYFEKLFRYGFQFTKDKELIKDAIQDLFIELRNKRKNLSDTTSIKLYLYKCLKRKILNFKERAINKMMSHQDLEGYNFEIDFSTEHLLIIKQLNEEKIKHLNQAMVHLTKRQKEAIYYFFYEDLSYEEVMEMMELSNIKSARNLIYKALDILKNKIASKLYLLILFLFI